MPGMLTDGPTMYQTLSGMLAPALFMTATGSLLITANNRLARAIDRLRGLLGQIDRLDQGRDDADFPADRIAKMRSDILRMQRRAALLLRAITWLYLAFGSFVATSLMLAVDAWTQYSFSAVPTGTAVVGVVLLLGACLHLFIEALNGVAVLAADVAFHDGLSEKRRNDRQAETLPKVAERP